MTEGNYAIASTVITSVNDRFVLVVGKSGAGKSTVANKILDPLHGPPFKVSNDVLPNDTAEMKTATALLETDHAEKYHVRVIDTQGFFDSRNVSNKAVISGIKKYLVDEIPSGLNLILFVFKHGRWTEGEQKMYDFITRKFVEEVSSISALVITGCENITDEERKRIVDEFKSRCPKVDAFMKQGIVAVGFPDISKLKEKVRQLCEEEQKSDQEKLRKLVYSCDDKILTKEIFKPRFFDKVHECAIL